MTHREKFYVLALISLYLFLLAICFNEIIIRFDDIEGYSTLQFDVWQYAFSCGLVLFLALALPARQRTASSFVLWVLFYLHVVPSLLFFDTVYAFELTQVVFFKTVVFVSYLGVTALVRGHSTDWFKTLGSRSTYSIYVLTFPLLAAVAFSLVKFHLTFGFKVTAPSFFSVYDVRATYIRGVDRLAGYVSILLGYFFAPFLAYLSYALWLKRRRLFALFNFLLACFCSYQVYAAAGFKSVALMFFAVLFFAIYLRRFKQWGYGLLISNLMLSLIVLGLAFKFILGFEDLALHWVRRVLVTPGLNTAYFFVYETIAGFSSDMSAPQVISNMFYGTQGSANSGFIGDGVARFGIYWFWVNFLILYGYLLLMDLLTVQPSGSYVALFLPTAYALSNSSITTVFLTYGLLFMLLFVFFFRGVLRHA